MALSVYGGNQPPPASPNPSDVISRIHVEFKAITGIFKDHGEVDKERINNAVDALKDVLTNPDIRIEGDLPQRLGQIGQLLRPLDPVAFKKIGGILRKKMDGPSYEELRVVKKEFQRLLGKIGLGLTDELIKEIGRWLHGENLTLFLKGKTRNEDLISDDQRKNLIGMLQKLRQAVVGAPKIAGEDKNLNNLLRLFDTILRNSRFHPNQFLQRVPPRVWRANTDYFDLAGVREIMANDPENASNILINWIVKLNIPLYDLNLTKEELRIVVPTVLKLYENLNEAKVKKLRMLNFYKHSSHFIREFIKSNPHIGYQPLADWIQNIYRKSGFHLQGLIDHHNLTQAELENVAPLLEYVDLTQFIFKTEKDAHDLIKRFVKVKHLTLKGYVFESLPSLPVTIRTFICRNISLESLPNLDTLEHLEISDSCISKYNEIERLPEMPNLKYLKLSLLRLKALPKEMNRLEYLDIEVCPFLKELPDGMRNLINLWVGRLCNFKLPSGMINLKAIGCPDDMVIPDDVVHLVRRSNVGNFKPYDEKKDS